LGGGRKKIVKAPCGKSLERENGRCEVKEQEWDKERSIREKKKNEKGKAWGNGVETRPRKIMFKGDDVRSSTPKKTAKKG